MRLRFRNFLRFLSFSFFSERIPLSEDFSGSLGSFHARFQVKVAHETTLLPLQIVLIHQILSINSLFNVRTTTFFRYLISLENSSISQFYRPIVAATNKKLITESFLNFLDAFCDHQYVFLPNLLCWRAFPCKNIFYWETEVRKTCIQRKSAF